MELKGEFYSKMRMNTVRNIQEQDIIIEDEREDSINDQESDLAFDWQHLQNQFHSQFQFIISSFSID